MQDEGASLVSEPIYRGKRDQNADENRSLIRALCVSSITLFLLLLGLLVYLFSSSSSTADSVSSPVTTSSPVVNYGNGNLEILNAIQKSLNEMEVSWDKKFEKIQIEISNRESASEMQEQPKSAISEVLNDENPTDPYSLPGKSESWFDELVPSDARKYFRNHLVGNQGGKHEIFTANFMRSTRSIVGNVERLRLFLDKVRKGVCTTTMVLGGSVSAGTNVGGAKGAYQTHFLHWLNSRYPCTGGAKDKHVMLYPKGPQTSSVVDGFPELADVMANEVIDLIFVEYGANDPFSDDTWVSRMDQPKKRLGTVQESLEWMTELLVRRLLYVRKYKNRSPALVYVEVSMHYAAWPWRKGWDRGKWHFMEQGHSGAWGHHPVLEYYGIPTINTIGPAARLWMGAGGEETAKDTRFFDGTDPCCHPSEWFHTLTGLAIAFHFQKEILWIEKELTEYEHDFTLKDPPVMRPPWRLTKADDKKYVTDYVDIQLDKITYWNFLLKEPSEENIGVNDGWTFYSDTRKNKTGMIATEVKSHISFKLDVMKDATILLGYLTTYENISPVNVWFDKKAEITDDRMCTVPGGGKATGLNGKARIIDPYNPTWKVSVYGSNMFDKIPEWKSSNYRSI